jgi:hypothetical protein
LNRGIFNTSFDAYVYYDVKRIGGAGTAKDVNKNKFVHINTGSHSASKTGPWSLGVCDAFKLVSVYKGGNTSVVTTDNDVTSHFELDDGQKDAFYDTSYLRQKADSTLDLTNCGLMVKFHYFSHNDAAGIGFYSMDSYLDIIDDDNPESATKITTQEIPVFTSPTSGRNYDLRDCVDFRPRKTNTVTPSATGTVAAAPTNPAALTAFYVKGTYGAYNPTPGENFESGIQYYLPRKDRVYVTSSGNFQVAQGIPDLSPTTPTTPTGAMSLGTLNIPPYPSLSPYVAKIYKRPDYAVKLTLDNNRRYTMSDLRAMDNRVKNLEYYSTLNLLETQAKNAQIFSASTGADRYKNGFFVDGFSSHNNADIRNKNYRAAIDSALGKLRPTYDRADVPMSQDLGLTSSNVTKTGDLITLSYTHESFINQPYASKLRNPVQELMFNWKGEVVLDPPMDNTPDITTLPDVQIDFSGFYDAIEFIANEAGVTGTDWGAWRTIASSSVSTAGAAVFNQIDDTWGDWLTQTTTTVTTSTQQQTGVVTTLEGASETISFGPLVENVSVRDYMRARTIRFTGLRMRPNTRVYAFFDDEAVSSYCTPTTSAFDATGSLEGDDLVTDSTGTVYGLFRIPDDENLRFRIGTKRFTLKDIEDPITQADLVTTSAHGDYTSIPLDVKQKSASIEMVVPQFSQDTVSRTRTVRSVTQSTRAWDPLAQSFFVSLPDETDGVYITKVDLFFGNKDSTLPVTVQLREMDNGTPTDIVVPYSSKTLYPADINVSTSTAVTPTTFTFDSPVFLQNGKDYTMVILPGGNSDQYTVWTAALGQYDVDAEDTLINKQIVAGTMFVSSNDKTWEPIQSEDLKFKLWRAKFSTSTGTVYVENNNEDYFSIDNISGSFRIGEPVRSECILTFANNDGMGVLSVGDVILSKAAKDGEAITASGFANGTIRQVVSANTGAGYWTVKIDALGDFTTDTSGNANYLYIPTSATSIGTATNFTANTATGTASFFHSAKNRLYVDASAGGFANGWVRGQLSGAASRVTSIDNLNMNTVVPKLPQIKHGKTQAAWAVRSTSTAGTIGSTWKAIELSQDNNFYDAQKKVYSYSNEIGLGAVGGSTKTLTLRGTFTTTDDYVSPVIDSSRFNSIVLANRINNDATDEHKEYGNAQMRYISKKVTLADGQDAEDMVVYINAFKPQNTNINVYAKIINGEDGDAFVDKDYTPLRQVTSSNTYSTGVDGTDIREFEYTFSANTNGQDFLGSTWANNHAYLNTSDSDIVAYRGTDGAFYHTFKSFAIKIVMTSSGTNLVPLINDVRAIALQK